jgi:hypothetical protein
MTEKPKFTVIDRRKVNAEGDSRPEAELPKATEETPASSGPRLVVPEESSARLVEHPEAAAEPIPQGPTAEQSAEQLTAYEKNAQGIEDLLRASNPGIPASEKIGFPHLVQQLYVTAMMQMGAGTPEGERPRVDILGARLTIDLLTVLSDKTAGNVNAEEKQLLEGALFELRMAFLELTNMINAQAKQPQQPPPPPGSVS